MLTPPLTSWDIETKPGLSHACSQHNSYTAQLTSSTEQPWVGEILPAGLCTPGNHGPVGFTFLSVLSTRPQEESPNRCYGHICWMAGGDAGRLGLSPCLLSDRTLSLSPCLHACSLRLREMASTSTPRKMNDSHSQLDREGNPLRTLRRRILSLTDVFPDHRKVKDSQKRNSGFSTREAEKKQERGGGGADNTALQHPCGSCGNGCFKHTENKSIWPERCITRNITAATVDRCHWRL